MHEALCRSFGTTLDILHGERRAADHSANIGSRFSSGVSAIAHADVTKQAKEIPIVRRIGMHRILLAEHPRARATDSAVPCQ